MEATATKSAKEVVQGCLEQASPDHFRSLQCGDGRTNRRDGSPAGQDRQGRHGKSGNLEAADASGSFEGIGTKGLPWLQQARKLTGLPVAIEVATAKQVEDALHFDVDVLWIGARTTVNPFSVQEVADALRGANVPVLIKNPINPDIELWTVR